MAWIMHSSGPWKDHKYKERSGSPGNYTYKYGSENDNTAGGKYNSENQYGDRENNKKTMVQAHKVMTNYLSNNDNVRLSTRVHTKGQGSQRKLMFSYANDRTGYQVNNNGLVGGEEAEKARAKRNARRRDFEKMTLTAMHNALNSAKENKKKSDADMRDAAVARGREQYMARRVANTINNIPNAVNQAKSNNRKSDADMRDAAVARGREQYMTNRAAKTVNNIQNAIRKKKEEEKRAAYKRDLARRAAYGR